MGLPPPLLLRSLGGPVLAVAAGKVKVELYGMAGCPFTRAFLEGPLMEALDTSSELVDMQLHAFGNTYYVTEECGGTVQGMPYASYFQGYNASIRECWENLCGAGARQPAEDCFSGELVSQHGVTDGMVTTAWVCAKAASGDASSRYMPFVLCTAHRFLGITSPASFEDVVRSCARATGIDGHETLACAGGQRGRRLLQAEARRTVLHPTVPYVLVDGELLGDTSCVACGDGILQKICEAWRARGGEDTPVCLGIFGKI